MAAARTLFARPHRQHAITASSRTRSSVSSGGEEPPNPSLVAINASPQMTEVRAARIASPDLIPPGHDHALLLRQPAKLRHRAVQSAGVALDRLVDFVAGDAQRRRKRCYLPIGEGSNQHAFFEDGSGY